MGRTAKVLGGKYEVTDDGRLFAIERDVIRADDKPLHVERHEMRLRKSNAGYLRACVRLNGKTKQVSIHRLVAMAFIPNPDGKREVNHVNGDKLDNRVQNLEWVTPRENIRHAFATGLAHPHDMSALCEANKRQVEVDGVGIFQSITEAAAAIGSTESQLCQVLRGNYKTTMGHSAHYVEAWL